MNTKIKIVRTYWGNNIETRREIPIVPIYDNQIVYVWGSDNEEFLISRGFKTKLMNDSELSYNDVFIRKLIVLDLALKEFGEVIMLDWDCYILRPLDDDFYKYLKSKPIQCPLYAQYKELKKSLLEVIDTNKYIGDEYKRLTSFIEKMEIEFPKYSWEYGDGLISPNFGFFYSSDVLIGEKLLNIAKKYKIQGCIEENAMFIYASCTLDQYIELYQPLFVYGVSEYNTKSKNIISKTQQYLNTYINKKNKMDIYLQHI
jgi:hypothetical protein